MKKYSYGLSLSHYSVFLIIFYFLCSLTAFSAEYTRKPETSELLPEVFNQVFNDLKTRTGLPMQIFLEVNVFEVIGNNSNDIGFIYDLLGSVGRFRGTDLAGNQTQESNLGVLDEGSRSDLLPAGANITSRIFEGDEGEVQAVLQAMAEDRVVTVHSNPILLTVEGVPACLESGDDIPFLSRASLTNIETFVSSFQHTGVRLDITPRVGYFETDIEHKNPYVYTKISATLSSFTRFREEGGYAQPIVDTRQYTTSVWLKSSELILIGGIFRNSDIKGTRGIPIVKDIPLLGRLFRSSSSTSGISQLFIMVRPKVFDIWSKGEVDSITEQERNFKSLRNQLDERAKKVETHTGPFEQFREFFLERSTPK